MKYEELYERYYTMVYRLGLLLLKNTQDAEDAAQTIFLKLMEKKPNLSDEDHTRAWLISVTRNHCRDLQRSFWHKHRTDLEELPEPSVEPFDKQESLLFEIFQSLPKKQREVVYLYYFEDYSVKEISQLLNRNESTVQSQLFSARKRMKKQFSTTKAAALVLALVVFVGFGTVAADAASGGKVMESIRELLSFELTKEEAQVAQETITLPIDVYASELAAIDDNYLVLANERGLLIYDRKNESIASALDLQEMDCNYFNARTLITRIFQDDGKLYLFNDHVEDTDNEMFYGKKNVTVSMPDFSYIFDLSALSGMENKNLNHELSYDNSGLIRKTTDRNEIETIYALWEKHWADYQDTFDEFQGAGFLNGDSEKYNELFFSRKALFWTDISGKKLLSCLTTDRDSNYQLYTKLPDGAFIIEPLNLILVKDDALSGDIAKQPDENQPGKSDQTLQNSQSGEDNDTSEPGLLPEFTYTGDDAVMETLCAYLREIETAKQFYTSEENSVYIPSPLIFDKIAEGEDLMVFCNLWSFTYYRNGNTLVCESGGEAPARLRLHPNMEKPGGYEVIEDLRTGDGQMYIEGIEEFCKGYPGMKKKYFSEKYDRDEIRKELIEMYVENNNLAIKYYKDYGWDPVLLDLE